MTNKSAFKPVNLKQAQWSELSDFAIELAQEMGMSVSLSDAIAFAVKFTRENRHKINKVTAPNG